MSNILVACHCKNSDFKSISNPIGSLHPQLFYKERASNRKQISENVDYVDIDTLCPSDDHQYKEWSSVPENSKDYIYTVNCSLYGMLRDYHIKKNLIRGETSALLISLLNDGWQILRPGGMIIIPVDDSIPLMIPRFRVLEGLEAINHQLDNLKQVTKDLTGNPWLVEAKTSNELLFTLSTRDINDKNFLVLIKPVVGGKKRKTRSRKSKKLITI